VLGLIASEHAYACALVFVDLLDEALPERLNLLNGQERGVVDVGAKVVTVVPDLVEAVVDVVLDFGELCADTV